MDQEKVTQSGEMEIDLLELLHLLRQKIWIVLAALLAGGILAGAATYFLIKPTYEASALLYVVSASNDSVVNLSDLQIGTNLTADYEELLLSRPVMESVIHNLRRDRHHRGRFLAVRPQFGDGRDHHAGRGAGVSLSARADVRGRWREHQPYAAAADVYDRLYEEGTGAGGGGQRHGQYPV